MQDDFELERICSELQKYKAKNRAKEEEASTSIGDLLVSNLVANSDQDISLGEYLQKQCAEEKLFPGNKLYGLLNELSEGLEMDDTELEDYDLSSINGSQRKELEKSLFINQSSKVRQSSDKRVKTYANSNAKLAKESSMRPLKLKRYSEEDL